MLGIYFSGTGNTKYCVTHIVFELDKNAAVYSIEDENAVSAIQKADTFVFGYIKVDKNKCVGCGLCVKCCPMGNIKLSENGIVFNNKCTIFSMF